MRSKDYEGLTLCFENSNNNCYLRFYNVLKNDK